MSSGFSSRLLAATALIGLGLAVAFPADAGKGRGDADSDSDDKRPKVRLRADHQAGFAPLTVSFTGRLINVAPDNQAFCHAGTFLMLKRGENVQILSGDDPACVHGPEKSRIRMTFSFRQELRRPGHYEFVAMVVTQEGTEFISPPVAVRVLSSPGG